MKEDILNLTNLKYFCDAVRLGFSGAAKANFVTQSAVSQGIVRLEKSLGVPLLAHHPNRFRLTPEGEKVFQEGQDILKRAAEFKQNLTPDGPYSMGNLEFACIYSFATAVIPRYLKRFREEYPDVKVNFHLGRKELVKEMIKAGTVDFGIVPDEGDLSSYEKVDIFRGNIRFYVSSKISRQKQEELGFILTEPDSKEALLLKQAYYKKFGRELFGILEVGSREVISNLVAEGVGIGYFPDYVAGKKESHLKEFDFGLELEQYRISAISLLGMKRRKSSTIFLSYFNNN